MTRKDFRLIAETLREARQNPDPRTEAAVDMVARAFADVLAAHNERFDRERFLAATREEQYR